MEREPTMASTSFPCIQLVQHVCIRLDMFETNVETHGIPRPCRHRLPCNSWARVGARHRVGAGIRTRVGVGFSWVCCDDQDIPYLSLLTTSGASAGIVLTVVPGQDKEVRGK